MDPNKFCFNLNMELSKAEYRPIITFIFYTRKIKIRKRTSCPNRCAKIPADFSGVVSVVHVLYNSSGPSIIMLWQNLVHRLVFHTYYIGTKQWWCRDLFDISGCMTKFNDKQLNIFFSP